jgi:Class III cytochrome C family
MSNRPSFLSPTGIVVAAVLLVVVIAVTILASPILFSPGSLNSQAKASTLNGVASHAELANDCGACHPAPWSSQTMADKCLACHTPVGAEMKAKNGIHGSLAKARTSPTCRGCHPEHHGPTGALTSLDGATFPHDLIGFSLRGHQETGKGTKFACADCHPKGYGTFDQAICADCHATIDAGFMSRHEADNGKDCLACHDGSGSAKVDHNKFAFKLTGKHAGVACKDCHTSTGSLQGLQNTPQDCYSCHAKVDKHNGSFGRQCEQCHTTAGWAGANFDHTVFPVDHGSDQQKATCQTCHPVDSSKYTCFGCHAHTTSNVVNEHEGRSLAQLTDCIKCHAGGRGGGG